MNRDAVDFHAAALAAAAVPGCRRARAFVQLGFFPLPLAQAYAWTAAILVYELDAAPFQRASNG